MKELRTSLNPFTFNSLLLNVLVLILFFTSLHNTEFSLAIFLDGFSNLVKYIKGTPEIEGSSYLTLSFQSFWPYFWALIETIEMAFVAIFVSIILSFPMAIFSSMNIVELFFPKEYPVLYFVGRFLYYMSILLANIFRSVNEMVWALIFVSAVGLGPMAGIMALTLHTTGVMSKLLSEGIEGINFETLKSVKSTGASFLKTMRYALMPELTPHFISVTLYRFESDVRSASVLGFVGAGGIGFYLFDTIRAFQNSDVATIIVMIVTVVAILDKFSSFVRSKFI